MEEIYVSVDVETDGKIPGLNSMLSLGAAAYTADKKLISVFEVNLETLVGAVPNPDTMAWWSTQPEAWKYSRLNIKPPILAMQEFLEWVKCLDGIPVFVGYPAGFDFLFVYWYLIYFTNESPFSFSALDIKSYMAGMTGRPYRECVKRNMPKDWFDKLPHNHTALIDAVGQGALFCNMLRQARR